MLTKFFFMFCLLWKLTSTKHRSWIGPDIFVEETLPFDIGFHGLESVEGFLFLLGGWKPSRLWSKDIFVYSAFKWTNVTSLFLGQAPSPRIEFATASIGSNIYIHGGSGFSEEVGNTILQDFFVLDCTRSEWINLSLVVRGTPPSRRFGHKMTATKGMIYVFGGSNSDGVPLGDLFVYDQLKMKWTNLSASHSFQGAPSPRSFHGFAALGEYLYIHGGRDSLKENLEDLYSFHPRTATWSNLSHVKGEVPSARSFHGFISHQEKIYVFGGFSDEGFLNDLLVFDTSVVEWSNLSNVASGAPPPARGNFAFASDGRFLFIHGGNIDEDYSRDLFLFDSAKFRWSNITGKLHGLMPSPRYNHGSAVSDGQLIVYGGQGVNSTTEFLNDFLIFNPIGLSWMEMVHDLGLPPRCGHKLVSVEKSIFIFGGKGAREEFTDTLLIVNTSSMIWFDATGSPSGISPSPRAFHGMAVIGVNIYLQGGENDENGFLDDMFVFNSVSNQWSNINYTVSGEFLLSRKGHGFASMDGKIFLHGGNSLEGFQDNLLVFDPQTLIWKDLTTDVFVRRPAARAFHGFTAASGRLFVHGGRDFFDDFEDLFLFDPSAREWIDISGMISGEVPGYRSSHVFVAVGEHLIMHGGFSQSSGALGDLRAVSFPKDVFWPTNVQQFVDIYDWDRIVIYFGLVPTISYDWKLCSDIFPCAVSILGNSQGTEIRRLGGNSIFCLKSDGCSHVLVEAVSILCDSNVVSNSLFHIQGSNISILRSSFSECASATDGAIVKSFEGARAIIRDCKFNFTYASGFGGALSAYGSSMEIYWTHFQNIRSVKGGGAIWAGAFQSCYGSSLFFDTRVIIDSCDFQDCYTESFGGSVLASYSETSSESVHVEVSNSRFLQSQSDGEGGAICLMGRDVIAILQNCTFENCSSKVSGGAIFAGDAASAKISCTLFTRCSSGIYGGSISAVQSSSLALIQCWFISNVVHGFGGGALYLRSSYFLAFGVFAYNNTATEGGGGALLWREGVFAANGSLCPKETIARTEHCFLEAGHENCEWQTCSLNSSDGVDQSTEFEVESNISCEIFGLSLKTSEQEDENFGKMRSIVCTEKNSAAYGPCIASEFKYLQVADFPSVAPTYPGKIFSFVAVKKDAYNQTIASDSVSVLQAFPVLKRDKYDEPDLSVSVIGSALAVFEKGVARFSFSLKPTFAYVDFVSSVAIIKQQPVFLLKGVDMQTDLSIQSNLLFVAFNNGSQICPAGYVLSFDDELPVNMPGICRFCPAGKYSVNPLAGKSESGLNFPECMNCPVGGNCLLGGNEIRFSIGNWSISNGIFILTSCPAGHELINTSENMIFSHDAQQCKACLPNQYVIDPNSDYCYDCPQGATCINGLLVPKIHGSQWAVTSGIWKIIGCPAGYYLSSQQCLLCPASFYCVGTASAASPCPDGRFAPPGTNSSSLCSDVVYVIFTVELAIEIQRLTDEIKERFENTLASCVQVLQGHVMVVATMQSMKGSYTTLTANVAMANSHDAALVVQGLSAPLLESKFALMNFSNVSLTSIQVTECVPGYVLLTSRTCRICPANFFCLGGSVTEQACPESTYSLSGANSSAFCFSSQFVRVKALLQISLESFNITARDRFRAALALACKVSIDTVTIEKISENRRAGGGAVVVESKIATPDASSAQTIRSTLSSQSLNEQLALQQLPPSTILSVSVSNEEKVENVPDQTKLTIGASIGGFFLLFFVVVMMYCLVHSLIEHRDFRAFRIAFNTAKPGERASKQNLPKPLSKHYTAKEVLGKGGFGCVIKAVHKATKRAVAIKILLPQGVQFNEKEVRQLTRESNMLQMFTAHHVEQAVHLHDAQDAVHVGQLVCWFVMELLDDGNLGSFVKEHGPVSDKTCIKVARDVLAALKVMHSEGVIHRDIKPENIMRCKSFKAGENWDGTTYLFKLIDFGTSLGVDEKLAKQDMMTLNHNRQMGEGTPPYMSPEMFKNPELASYPTDLWSLGVSMFELVTASLPFQPESDLLWSSTIAGDLDSKAPNVLDMLTVEQRPIFDHNLARVIETALEKHLELRYASADQMHDDVYSCLIARGEAYYSAFISYRVLSETPLARLLFDELNHSVTPSGHRVTVYWDSFRLVKGEDWEEGFTSGLLRSLCFIPLVSYGFTAPLATLPEEILSEVVNLGWDEKPVGRARLKGSELDAEDNVLKELLIAQALLERKKSVKDVTEHGILQSIFPILVGRQHPPGHPAYPRMGSFFDVQGGRGQYPKTPSPATNRVVGQFLREKAFLPDDAVRDIEGRSVASAMERLVRLQGCQLWKDPPSLVECMLSKEQTSLVEMSLNGPCADLEGVVLDDQQRASCVRGLDERQLRILKAQVRAHRSEIHEVIDRALAELGGGTLHTVESLARRRSSVIVGNIATDFVFSKNSGRNLIVDFFGVTNPPEVPLDPH